MNSIGQTKTNIKQTLEKSIQISSEYDH